MASAHGSSTAKLGAKQMQVSGDHEQASLQQLDTHNFALEALRRKGCMTNADMLEYGSTLKLVEYLRHRNPNCCATISTYIPNLKMICKALAKTPDQITEDYRDADEDGLEELFLKLDQLWIQRNDSPSTRIVKWSALNTFLKSNGIRRVKLIQMNIRNQVVYDDEAVTRSDCRKALTASRTNRDRLLISLLIESLQRPSTISCLTWGDMRPHIESGETVFLIKIDARRTKRNIAHWAPIGPLSTYYIKELLKELKNRHVEVRDDDSLVSNCKHQGIAPLRTNDVIMRVSRILDDAGVRGRRFGDGEHARFEKHAQSFRKFGRIAMQDSGAPDEAIEHLMGHKTSQYSKWLNRKDELLNIYIRCMPRLEDRDAAEEVIRFANSLGLTLDRKALSPIRECTELGVHEGNSPECVRPAGA